MALRTSYTTLSPEFDGFLCAPIGEEGNGMSLSVMSALTRLDIDPWREAARLSKLSRAKAAEALAPIIAQLPVGRWAVVDIPAIAQRLVEFLPGQDAVVRSVATVRVSNKVRARAAYVILLVLVAVVYFGFVARQQSLSGKDPAAPAISDATH